MTKKELQGNIISGMRVLIKYNKINQEELAKRAIVTPAAISQILTGRRNPTTFMLIKIADALGTDLRVLTGHKNPPVLSASDINESSKLNIIKWKIKEINNLIGG